MTGAWGNCKRCNEWDLLRSGYCKDCFEAKKND